MKQGWKVLRLNRTSAYIPRIFKEWIVEYPINTKVYPPKDCGPLAVFNTEQCAETFRKVTCWVKTIIVPCEYEPIKDIGLWFADVELYTEDYRYVLPVSMLPEGTEMTNWVRCLK